MSIIINVVNQKMHISSGHHIVSGSQKFVKFRFNLSDEWDGLTVFAQFKQGTNAYNQYLDHNNSVSLPKEIKAGICTLMLYGNRDDVIGTTNYLTLKIDENNLVSNASSTDISKSLYDQLTARINAITSWDGHSVTEFSERFDALESQITDGVTDKELSAEITRAKSAEQANATKIASLDELVSETRTSVSELKTQAINLESIVKGRATGYVFDTIEDLDAWLSDANNTASLILGDNLYVRATDVPDYWWDGERKQQLETQKVDLAEYVQRTDYVTYDKAGIVQILPESGFVIDEGGKIRIHPASLGGIINKESLNNPITPATLDFAVRRGLIDPKNVSWTEEDRQSARETLGTASESDLRNTVQTVAECVKNKDYATSEKAGIVRISNSSGLKMSGDALIVNPATESSISGRANMAAPITPKYLDYGVCAALTDPKNVTWTPANQEAAMKTLGIDKYIEETILGGAW